MANLQVGVAGNGTVTVGAGASVHSPASNTLTLGTNGDERLRIDSSGKLGVGLAAPTRTLTVQSNGGQIAINDTDNTQGELFVNAGNFSVYCRGDSNLGDGSTAGYFTVNTHPAGGSITERLRVTSSGRLLVGTTSYKSNLNSSADASGQLAQFVGAADDTNKCVGIFAYSGTSNPTARGAKLQLNRARSTDGTTNTAVASGDLIGTVEFKGNDATSFTAAAKIDCLVDGSPGTDDMPGRLIFSTSADGSGVPTERVRIDKNGQLVLSNGSMSTAYGNSICGGTNLELDTTGIIKFRTDTNQKMSVTDNGLCFGTDSASANALDDYEEGSFTPGLSNGGTLTVYSCKYTKIGREVTIHAYFYVQDIPDNGNNFLITGLPYAITSDTSAIAGGCWSYGGNLTDAYKMAPSGSPGGSVAHFYWLDGANSGGILQNNSFDGTGPNNTRYIGFKLFYYT